MKNLGNFILGFMPLCILSGTSVAFAENSAPCSPSAAVHEVCQLNLTQAHPTQFAVGELEVNAKVKKFKKMSASEISQYASEHQGLVVIGPGNTLYLADGHHIAAALLKVNKETMPVEVAANLSTLSETDFEKNMLANHWTWLLDENGKSGKTFSQLPTHVADLGNNLYRSLAWLVRKAGGYSKTSELWTDFLWSEYFRAHITIADKDTDMEKATKEALKIVHSPDAKDLPGYTAK